MNMNNLYDHFHEGSSGDEEIAILVINAIDESNKAEMRNLAEGLSLLDVAVRANIPNTKYFALLGEAVSNIVNNYVRSNDVYREIVDPDPQREDLGHSQEEEDRLANPRGQ